MKDDSPAGSSSLVRTWRIALPLLLDLVIVLVSYSLALYLKFDANVPAESWNQLIWAGPLIALAYIAAYQILGVYKTAWQYGGVRDALLLAFAVAIVTAGILTVQVMLPKRPIPLTVNVISAAFIFLFHAMARMLPRLTNMSSFSAFSNSLETPRKRVLIVGAGGTGQMLAAELQHNPSRPYRAVCFVDDDESLRGKRIHGVPVAGNRFDIPAAIDKYDVQMIAVALPDRAPALQDVLSLSQPYKVPVRMVPRLSAVMSGQAQTGEMREVTMEDLLAREPVDVDVDACREVIEGKVVLITGAAGSIGSQLTRMVLGFEPAAVHLVDVNETGLHELRIDLNAKAGGQLPIKPWLCSIVDRKKLEDIFEASRPQVVFHLAAYKHITMVEENPDQAFDNNVIGTLNVFECAEAVRAAQVVFVSSHTAVNPTSIYGATKRVGELLIMSMPASRTRYCAVRSVNAIDAKGAVLGIFERQLDRGQPISVTDPEVARYFLTIDELAGLLIQSASLTHDREIFLVDVGEEVRIGELAERLIRARGLEPGVDVEIVYTGLRKGEKLREALAGEHETLDPTAHPRVLSTTSPLQFSGAELRAGIRELEVDLRRRTGNVPAKLHALARFDQAAIEEATTPSLTEAPEPEREPKQT